MPHKLPDLRHRASLTELMDDPASRDELRACLRDLESVNRWTLGYRPLLHWLKAALPARNSHSIHILDVACGYGDGLRKIERWARSRRLRVELTGLDLSQDTVAIAAEATPRSSSIRWVSSDIFAFRPQKPIHFVISSLFTHHLTDADVVRFVKWMEVHAVLGWFINDLSRHPTPYRLFRAFSRLMRFHPYVQHDGPVSIARSFVPEDWSRICSAAGLRQDDVTIRGFTPGRLCVGRTKTL
jgi:trans-aconitate methyltransferase